jgi:hypothetical protein
MRRKSAGQRFSHSSRLVPTDAASTAYTLPAMATAGKAIRTPAASAGPRPSVRQVPTSHAAPTTTAAAANSTRVRPASPSATPASSGLRRASASSSSSSSSRPNVAEFVCGRT